MPDRRVTVRPITAKVSRVGSPPAIDASRPNVARVYDYLLGGKDNFESDRALGDQIIAALPAAQDGVRAQREVLARVVRFLVGDEHVTQLLDIGSGLPTAENVHQVAQAVDPRCDVVYVDNDPVVVSHARALLDDSEHTFAAAGDLRDPAGIIAAAGKHLDWTRPVGLLLCGIVHFLPDEEAPHRLVTGLIDALPAGSYVFIHHLLHTEDVTLEAAMKRGLGQVQFRTREQILALFAGLDLVDPGLVLVPDWRPGPSTPRVRDHPVLALAVAGVARKP
ncbi:MAG TPA: SAM-dependent methyltransferase [Trebonia sp.]|nr:SAM-dependent methyltransferase [Trebonia sp.]